MVTTLTMPLVWASAAGKGLIENYNAAQFTVYYLAMLVIGSFVTSHIMWELAMEIREGVFTKYLTRPFSFFQTIVIRNFSWRTIRLVMTIPFVGVMMLFYGNMLQGAQVFLGWQFWVAFILGHCVSISVVLMMSAVALFTTEAIAVFELYYVPQLFLSGYLFPITMMPVWAQEIAHVLPFYYTTGLPTELVVGRMPAQDAMPFIGGQLAWIAISVILGRVMWKSGLKHYTGAGM